MIASIHEQAMDGAPVQWALFKVYLNTQVVSQKLILWSEIFVADDEDAEEEEEGRGQEQDKDRVLLALLLPTLMLLLSLLKCLQVF